MRIRPFFWFLLVVVCVSILIFATNHRSSVPARIQVYLDEQSLVSAGMTLLEIHLTDPQGIPIEQAKVLPSARMTNMDMNAQTSLVRPLGNGAYQVKIHLDMAGPWEITIQAQARGFIAQEKILEVEVR